MILRSLALAAASLSLAAAPAQAQLGDLGKSVLGGALPDVGSVGVGNATGLLGYCLKNKLMRTVGVEEESGGDSGGGLAGAVAGAVGGVTGGTTAPAPEAEDKTDVATTIFNTLRGRKGVAKSPGYLAGSKGVLQAQGSTLPIGNLGGQVKGKLCDMVLGRAKDLL